MSTINSFKSYQTMPVSFYGRWLVCGANSWAAKKSENYKFINSIGRRSYAFVGSWVAAPLGILFHVNEGVITLFQSIMVPSPIKELSLLKEKRKKELRERAWDHFTAAKIDCQVLIKGVWFTALATVLAASVVFLMPFHFSVTLILGSLTWITVQLLCFDDIASSDRELDNLPQYLPSLFINQLIGMHTLKKLNFKLIEPSNTYKPGDLNKAKKEKKEIIERLNDIKKRKKNESDNQVLLNTKNHLLLNKKDVINRITRIKNTRTLNQRKEKINEFLVGELGKLTQLVQCIKQAQKPMPINLWINTDLLIVLDKYIEILDHLRKRFGSFGSVLTFKIVRHHIIQLQNLFVFAQVANSKNEAQEEKEKEKDPSEFKANIFAEKERAEAQIAENFNILISKFKLLFEWAKSAKTDVSQFKQEEGASKFTLFFEDEEERTELIDWFNRQ